MKNHEGRINTLCGQRVYLLVLHLAEYIEQKPFGFRAGVLTFIWPGCKLSLAIGFATHSSVF